ncbi:hypothetical protein RHMOL_Rhmol12G0094600 [Rhododendron molle]|uniref:Uncharacterized protein n=1 Tax=Rhododendron molle TaxID=49168 RepID=A0ACC0LGE3_RHOML|nr:hypothetical protein RHMOL_Rhmol12G0094600 [Rhododendron molle]
MNEELERKVDEMGILEDLNQTLIVKERQSNNELQARKELITGLSYMLSGHTLTGLKIMGEIYTKPYQNTCKVRFPASEAEVKAFDFELCSLWQERMKNPDWHPFKIVALEGGYHQNVYEDAIRFYWQSLMDVIRDFGSGDEESYAKDEISEGGQKTATARASDEESCVKDESSEGGR